MSQGGGHSPVPRGGERGGEEVSRGREGKEDWKILSPARQYAASHALPLRLLRVHKNRHGPTDEVGVFKMDGQVCFVCGFL